MKTIKNKKVFIARNLILVLLTLQFSFCTGQVKEKSVHTKTENEVNIQPLLLNLHIPDQTDPLFRAKLTPLILDVNSTIEKN